MAIGLVVSSYSVKLGLGLGPGLGLSQSLFPVDATEIGGFRALGLSGSCSYLSLLCYSHLSLLYFQSTTVVFVFASNSN